MDDNEGKLAATVDPATLAEKSEKSVVTTKLRDLREIEREENEKIRKLLYTTPLDDDDIAVEEEMNTQDTVRLSREARQEFNKATMRPIKEKMLELRGFMRLLDQPQHKRVVAIFFFTTIAMFTIPILVLLIGMHVIAPLLEVDAGVCGGFMALGSTVIIMGSYVTYALLEPFSDTVEKEDYEKEKKNK
ncbi:uncharacterized protein TM35_000042550 [Trypanosoma theileri]|uniref:Uncharacterized protein n=1 Tax=Trypanosoma theileri TaxID=67003 RepID=A0A1X0P5D2_9TRYP|nr:uncharacterized protein TM35_000042550 [Trypanosoma theileri]ORC92041.1 hypothetical protein TM35_000042550 [Trypanosoma theileri]